MPRYQKNIDRDRRNPSPSKRSTPPAKTAPAEPQAERPSPTPLRPKHDGQEKKNVARGLNILISTVLGIIVTGIIASVNRNTEINEMIKASAPALPPQTLEGTFRSHTNEELSLKYAPDAPFGERLKLHSSEFPDGQNCAILGDTIIPTPVSDVSEINPKALFRISIINNDRLQLRNNNGTTDFIRTQ